MKGIGGHHQAKGRTDIWLTPPVLLRKLGTFDLDPCGAPEPRLWDTALRHITLPQNGLTEKWAGRVWLNPPYGDQCGRWMGRMAEHGNGIALVFARTETAFWFRHIWPKADAVLFIAGRLCFLRQDGRPQTKNAGGPSALVAYGRDNEYVLQHAKIGGCLVRRFGGTVMI